MQYRKTNTVYMSTDAIAIVAMGVLSLAIAIGVSRFGFSILINELKVINDYSIKDIGLIASANLLGYLAGVILMMVAVKTDRLNGVLYFSVAINVASMIVLSDTSSFNVWLVSRFVGGLSSGVVFIVVSTMLVNALHHLNCPGGIPILFSGVGVGIFVSSVFAFLAQSHAGEMLSYKLDMQSVAGITGVMLLVCIARYRKQGKDQNNNLSKNNKVNIELGWWYRFVLISYFLEGMGYIIFMTYVFPQQLNNETNNMAEYSWMMIGVGATVGPVIFLGVKRMLSSEMAIIALYVLQIISIGMVVMDAGATGVIGSAFIFGATFMGLTSAFIYYVRLNFSANISPVIVLTVVYATGQMLGPYLSSYYGESQGYGYEIMLRLSLVTILLAYLFYQIPKVALRSCKNN